MILRVLPQEEWNRLVDHPMLAGATLAEDTIITVAEDSTGQIIGLWLAMNVKHMEGFWIHPDHRKKSTLPVRLVNFMEGVLRKADIKGAVCWAEDSQVEEYLVRLGMEKMDVRTYLYRIDK